MCCEHGSLFPLIRGRIMISLTRINGTVFILNAELIESIDTSPDTIVSLVNGHKYLVKDSDKEVIEKVFEYKRSILSKPLNNS